MQLKNKVAVITGGGKGLGKELAIILAKEGCNVVICSRSKVDLENVCSEIKEKGGNCKYFVTDVTNENQVSKLIDKIVTINKKIDILVNNVGYVHSWKPIEYISEEEFDVCFKTNVYSMFYFLRKTIPIMRKQGEGVIVNISSTAGKRALPNVAAYSASKFAVLGLTQSVSKELKDTKVFCFAVCPGGMNTGIRVKVFGTEDARKQQSPEFVATVIKDVLTGKIKVPNGGDISIRHDKVTAIDAPSEIKEY